MSSQTATCTLCSVSVSSSAKTASHFQSRAHQEKLRRCSFPSQENLVCHLLKSSTPHLPSLAISSALHGSVDLNSVENCVQAEMIQLNKTILPGLRRLLVKNPHYGSTVGNGTFATANAKVSLVEVIIRSQPNGKIILNLRSHYLLLVEKLAAVDSEVQKLAERIGLLSIASEKAVNLSAEVTDNPDRELRIVTGLKQGKGFSCNVNKWMAILQESDEKTDYEAWFKRLLSEVQNLKRNPQATVYSVEGGKPVTQKIGSGDVPLKALFKMDIPKFLPCKQLQQRNFLCQMFVDSLAALCKGTTQSVNLKPKLIQACIPIRGFVQVTVIVEAEMPHKAALAMATSVLVEPSVGNYGEKSITFQICDYNQLDRENRFILKLCSDKVAFSTAVDALKSLCSATFVLNIGGATLCDDYSLAKTLDVFTLMCTKCRCRYGSCNTCVYGRRLIEWSRKLWSPCGKLSIPRLDAVDTSTGPLNQEQAKAAYLSSPKGPLRNVSAIWGPPGTGKTHTLGSIISGLHVKHGEMVLAFAPTNTAADAIALAILAELPPKRKHSVIRAYSTMCLEKGHNVPAKLENYHIVFDARQSSSQTAELRASGIVVCTVASAIIRHMIFLNVGLFDVAVYDEAGRTSIPECFASLGLAKRAIFCGDHKQLKPYVDQTNKYLKAFHWDYSMLQFVIDLGHPVTQLSKNYRSIRPILEPSNDFLYSANPLIAAKHESHEQSATAALTKHPFLRNYFTKGIGLSVVPVMGRQVKDASSPSIFNLEEATAVYRFIIKAWQTGLYRFKPSGSAEITVGVVCFYNAQNELLQQLIMRKEKQSPEFKSSQPHKWLKILSVEQFQGLQANWVLLTGCRGGPQVTYKPDCRRTMGFLAENDRLNVALTRAKYGVIAFLRPAQYVEHPFWSRVLERAHATNGFSDISGNSPQEELAFSQYIELKADARKKEL